MVLLPETDTLVAPETPDIDGGAFNFDFSSMESETTEKVTPSRGTTTTGRRRGRPPGSKSERRVTALKDKLSSEMFQAGALIGMAFNTTGYYICQESDGFVDAVLKLAARKPEWLDALENVADIQPGLVVGRTALGIGAAFAVDRKRVDPEKPFLKFLGVYSAWAAVNKGSMNGHAEGSSYRPPPATFVPVA